MGKPLRIRIESDGPEPHRFKISDADTGEEITNVVSVSFEADRRDDAVLTLEVTDFEVSAVAQGRIERY